MKVLEFVIVATIFEAVGDAVMRIALQSPSALRGRIALHYPLALVFLAFWIGTFVTGVFFLPHTP